MPRRGRPSNYKPDLTPEQLRARDAVLKSQRMLPQIRTFVRVIARNPRLNVKLTQRSTATDGHTVWIQVPIRLADMGAHTRGECGQKDAVGVPRCTACAIMEEVYFYLYHEVAHLLSGSFVKIPGDAVFDVLTSAIHAVISDPDKRDKFVSKVEAAYDALPEERHNYVELGRGLSQWFPMLLNVVEDIRVNDWMTNARPGTKGMFFRQLLRTMIGGAQVKPNECVPWAEVDPNAQLCIGFFYKCSGLDISEFFHEQIVADLNTDEMEELVNECAQLESMTDTWYSTVRLYEQARNLGYFPEPEDEPEPEPEEQESEPGEPGEEGEPGEPGKPGDGAKGDQPGKGAGKPKQDDEADIEADQDQDNPEEGEDPDQADPSEEGAQDDASDPDGADADQGQPDDGPGGTGHPGAPGGGPGGNLPPQNLTPEDIEGLIAQASAHGDNEEDPANPYSNTPEPAQLEEQPEEQTVAGAEDGWYLPDHGDAKDPIKQAIFQAAHFDTPSRFIQFTKEYTDTEDPEAMSWRGGYSYDSSAEKIEVPRQLVTASIARMRRIFHDNKATRMEGNLKRGKSFDARTLGYRIPVEDPRIMKKRLRPGKKDHSVLIGLDVSGSTAGGLDRHIIAMGAAQAELCEATGVEFAVYAHTGMGSYLEIYIVKTWDEPWGPEQKRKLARLRGSTANLDGHTMEYYRKAIQRRRTTDKLMLYFTDGAMPAENYDEELYLLQREISMCQKLGIKLVGVGVRTDSPKEHGLDTIRCDRMDDIPAMITELEKRLIKQ